MLLRQFHQSFTFDHYLFSTTQSSNSLSRRGSSFYNFVSSMRSNDSFRLFSSAPDAAKTSADPPNTTELKTEITPPECLVSEDIAETTKTDDLIVSTRTKDLVKQRSVMVMPFTQPNTPQTCCKSSRSC